MYQSWYEKGRYLFIIYLYLYLFVYIYIYLFINDFLIKWKAVQNERDKINTRRVSYDDSANNNGISLLI